MKIDFKEPAERILKQIVRGGFPVRVDYHDTEKNWFLVSEWGNFARRTATGRGKSLKAALRQLWLDICWYYPLWEKNP